MNLAQFVIFITGISGAAMVASAGHDAEVLGYAILLLGQPAWIIESLRAKQWGILTLTMFYTAINAAGLLTRVLP